MKLTHFNQVKNQIRKQFMELMHEVLNNPNFKKESWYKHFEIRRQWDMDYYYAKSKSIKELYDIALTYESLLNDIFDHGGSNNKYEYFHSALVCIERLNETEHNNKKYSYLF